MAYVFFALFAAWAVVGLIVLPWRITAVSPERDQLRIKRDYEGQGREVVEVRRIGTDWGGRYTPTYRRYAVTVRRHDGETAEFVVGVAFGLASDAELQEYDPEKRRAFFKGSQSHF